MAAPFAQQTKSMQEKIQEQEKANILLVDDQEENLLVFGEILSELNQNLIKTRSGKEALKVLLHQEVAVILLDVTMPEMDGFETASLIREREKLRAVPIIFVTGMNMDASHVFRGYSVGAVDYILKPFAPEILKSKVAVFVELFKKTEKIKKLNETLEQRVAERTAAAEERAKELARANAELEQFAYVVSHDLKEPLRMVSSYCSLLQNRYKEKLDEKANEFISYAVDGAARMYQMINNLLSFSSLSAKGKVLRPTKCETVLQEVIQNLKVFIQEQAAVVTHDPLPEILADPTQMAQLFQNLIHNGIKFHGDKAPQVHLSAKRQNGEWLFSVRDNGIGVQKECQEFIFRIFNRLHGAKTYPGNGIGLATCKKIVEQHGGRIWLESEPQKGATFYFTLPRKEGS